MECVYLDNEVEYVVTDEEQEMFHNLHRENKCHTCRFSDTKAVIAGEPCCTRLGGPEPGDGPCKAHKNKSETRIMADELIPGYEKMMQMMEEKE